MPAQAADLSEVSNYAAGVGNRKTGTSTTRTGLTGADVWDGLEFYETDTGATWEHGSSGWARKRITRLGRARLTSPLVLSVASTWTDVLSVTVTSTGGLTLADWRAYVSNQNSGSRQIAQFRVLCDGTQVDDTLNNDLPWISGATSQYAAGFEHELSTAAGSHVWKLQVQCSSASAISVNNAVLILSEV
ncbi:hypothetical protein O159_23110 [Leifsonia xyli subsp. cynodontis DSM 46306]|uniref:Uncharacterized protein n=1 Tax=Leifsonia xyli subsp. cynodontis DSM 46306 TaxID=1389489 RepID=U3P8F3_LEIXC|nr:hypothetical protein O159_17060 [Leifsonia xyli subsp. cynodontis DSM 46306]AGW42272.1 hypothetical protein O159_23110 [Leifsonia xyli subsp. cynodontis DSM 46306]